MRWQGTGVVVTSDDYDEQECIKGETSEDDFVFDTYRIKTLKDQTLPHLKRLIDDNKDKYNNYQGKVQFVGVDVLTLQQLYKYTSKLLKRIEEIEGK